MEKLTQVELQKRIFDLLSEVITSEPTDWDDIVSKVKEQLVIKNWMVVRGVLQFMMDAKLVARTKNIHEEKYVKLT